MLFCSNKSLLVLIIGILFFSNKSIIGQAIKDNLLEVNSVVQEDFDSYKVLKGGKMVDVVNRKVIDNCLIVIKGNRIEYAGDYSNDYVLPENCEVTNIHGKTVIPGLIDPHLHTINNDSLLNLFLKNGVTALRDPGHPFRFYQVIELTNRDLPRIYLTGAHFDAYPAAWPQQAVMIKNNNHIRQTISDYVNRGSTGIKIYFRSPLKYYETIIETARLYGIPVTAHLELVSAVDAIKAGLIEIEHVTSFGTSLATYNEAYKFVENVSRNSKARSKGRYLLWSNIDLKSHKTDEVIDLMKAKNVVFCPTLTTFERQEGDSTIEEFEWKGFNKMLEFVKLASQAGIELVCASHTSGKYVPLGWAYQREMELFVKAGISPMEVIRSSTLNGARYLGASSRIGSLEKDKLADLIIVEGNPVENISDMYNVEKVLLNGVWIKK